MKRTDISCLCKQVTTYKYITKLTLKKGKENRKLGRNKLIHYP
jgi:hypothetical protein